MHSVSLHPLCASLKAHGFDLSALCDLSTLSAWSPLQGAAPTALVVANTRALWPPFLQALRANPALRCLRNPLDAYTQRAVTSALQNTGLDTLTHSIHWAHTLLPEPIPIQAIAEHAGLTWTAPCGLGIHPTYGPWLGLRAVVCFHDLVEHDLPSQSPLSCDACEHRCMPAFRNALKKSRELHSSEEIWHLWVAVRDACPRGAQWRYGEHQLRYHYTQDRTLLAQDDVV